MLQCTHTVQSQIYIQDQAINNYLNRQLLALCTSVL